jgi:hypothetical protein
MKIQKKPVPALSSLVRQLSRDRRLKQAIVKVRRRSRGKRRTQLESVADLYLLILAIVAQFSRKKRARALEQQMDVVSFLVQLSLSVKENIFDRPEVQQLFARGSQHLYRAARRCIALAVPEKGRVHAPRRAR